MTEDCCGTDSLFGFMFVHRFLGFRLPDNQAFVIEVLTCRAGQLKLDSVQFHRLSHFKKYCAITVLTLIPGGNLG